MLGGFVDGEVAFYFLDGECASCGSMVTLPTPKDYDANL
jgi:rRNA maturation protein Nop10